MTIPREKTISFKQGIITDHTWHYRLKVGGMDFDMGVPYVFTEFKYPDGTKRSGWKRANIWDFIKSWRLK